MAEAADLIMGGAVDSNSKHFSEDYCRSFLKVMHQLRRDEVFCDVQMKVENTVFSCHKVVLMASSPYFFAMFISNMAEHDKDTVDIGGVSHEIFSVLLDFIYSGEIKVTEDNCEELFIAADMFSIKEIISICSKFLKEKLQPENCIGIYKFADTVSCSFLKREAESYIHKNFLKVTQEEEFLNLEKKALLHILESECLHVENEYQVFKAAMNWIQHSPLERRKLIFDVMAPIRFPIISEAQMDKYLASLSDSELSIKIALQKILGDFKSERKSFGLLDTKLHTIKHHLTVPRKCSRKNIYLCGGFTRPAGGRWSDAKTLNTVERYDTFYKTWHESPGFQFHRSALGAGVLEGQVCIVGGENDMLILDSVESYDPVTYEWKSLPGLTTPRCGLGVCSIDNCLYAVGGWIGSEIGGTVEKYDPELQKWSVIAHCRSLKCWMGVTADKGLIYVVGGCNDLGDELKCVESFNPTTKEWITLADLNIKRSYTGVTFLDDCLYAVGGWNEPHGALQSVEKYNFDKGYWIEVAPLSAPRAAASVVVVNNMIYAMGGRNSSQDFSAPCTLDTVEGYDPRCDSWIDMGNMLSSRCEAAAVII